MPQPIWLASPTPTSACAPGRDGVPGSAVGELLCGPYLTGIPRLAADIAHSYWPRLAVILGVVLAVRVSLAVARGVAVRRSASGASFMEIVPPVTATPAATLRLWRLLATLLPAPHRWTVRAHRLVWEVEAVADQMRCGIWVPAGINPTAVIRAVQKAWPGAQVTHTAAPEPDRHRILLGRTLRPTCPEWFPLTDPGTGDGDEIGAVFDGLAAAGRTGAGLLHLVVTRAPRARLAVLRTAARNPAKARSGRGTLRVLTAAAGMLRAAIQTVLDLLTPGPNPSRPQNGAGREPWLAEQARDARGKAATGPHVLAAVHTYATGPTRAAARAAAADITAGFTLLTTALTPRRLARAQRHARLRHVPERRSVLMTAAELAAFAALPAEPALYGLPAAPARRRPAGRSTWRSPTPADDAPSDIAPRRRAAGRRPPAETSTTEPWSPQ